jgi:hypothetical protein
MSFCVWLAIESIGDSDSDRLEDAVVDAALAAFVK